MTYDGLVAGVLGGVGAAIEAAKASLGLNYVRVGNAARGWVPPAAFVFLGATGAPRGTESRRRGVHGHLVHVDIVIVAQRNATRSMDVEVLEALGKVPEVLAAAMPLAGTRHLIVENAGQVGSFLDRRLGAYETEGRVQVVFEAEATSPRPGT